MSSRDGRKSGAAISADAEPLEDLPPDLPAEMRRANRLVLALRGLLLPGDRLALCRALALAAAIAARLGGNPLQRLLQSHRLGVGALGQSYVDLAPIDIGAIAAVAHGDLATVRMIAQLLQCGRGSAARSVAGEAVLLLGDDGDGAIEADREHVLDRFEIGVGTVVLHEGAVTTDAGGDHLAGLGMPAHVPRQREERQRLLVVHFLRLPALRQAGALGFLAFAALDVGAEAAALQHDLLARVRIRAEHPVAGF